MQKLALKDCFIFLKKSGLKASDSLTEGNFPFYSSSKRLSKYTDTPVYEGESLIFGTGGMASIHYASTQFSTSNDCFVVQKNSSNIFTKYVYHFLNSNIHILENGFRGAGLKHISKDYITKIKIPLPPLEEQKRIAAILDKADAIRRKRQQAIDLTDQLLRSVFLDMFGDPVTNPKGWTKSKFGEVTQSRLGKMLDAKQQTGLHQHFYLRNPNVQWGKIVLNELKTMDFDEKDQQEFSLKSGDVLICEGGEVGRAAIWREDMEHCYFQKALHRVRPNKDVVNSEYICDLMWFMAKHGGLKVYVSSATIAHLTGAKIKSMEIPIPPINLQNKYAAYVNKYQESINALEKSQDAIGELLGSITRRAFCGELTKQSKAA
jgi:type I restriction enzyme S subunit